MNENDERRFKSEKAELEAMLGSCESSIATYTTNDLIIIIQTTQEYWDCECKENYIHPKSQNKCFLCRTSADERPDSRIIEVIKYMPLHVIMGED